MTRPSPSNNEDAVIVVSRWSAMRDYLVETGFVPPDARLVNHATAADLDGKHVFGHLPFHLAKYCASVTVVPVLVPTHRKGVELTVEDLREYAGDPETYEVTEIPARGRRYL